MRDQDIENMLADYSCGMIDSVIRKKYEISRAEFLKIRKERNIPARSRNFLAQKQRNQAAANLILCKICNREFSTLAPHLKVHNINSDEYMQMYDAQIQTCEQHEKLSVIHKEKYEKHPHLKEALRIVGRKNITKCNESGKGWRMPKGYHTDEFKTRISTLLKGREITWKDKIREAHWSRSNNAKDVIDKIVKSSNKNYRTGWYTSTKTCRNEYYHSSFELRRMYELDEDSNVQIWTKGHGIMIPYSCNENKKQYIPDFLITLIDGQRILEEVKGWVFNSEEFQAKCDVAIDYCNKQLLQTKFVVNFMQRSKIKCQN